MTAGECHWDFILKDHFYIRIIVSFVSILTIFESIIHLSKRLFDHHNLSSYDDSKTD